MELKKKNKKGQIFAGLTVGIVIVVALLILIFTAGILSFLKNNIFIILGAFLFVGGLIYLIKSQSDTRTKTTVFFVMLIIGSILVFSNGVLQNQLAGESNFLTGSGNYIRPIFYYDKCEAISSMKTTGPYDIITTKGATTFNNIRKPSLTNSYSVDITIDEINAGINPRRLVYSICPEGVFPEQNSCPLAWNNIKADKLRDGQILQISEIGNENALYIQFQQKYVDVGWASSYKTKAHYVTKFIPYGIKQYNVLGGNPNPLSNGSCTYITKPADSILNIIGSKISSKYAEETNEPSTNEKTLQPEEVRWYVGGNLYAPPEDLVIDYNGQEAWCRPTGTNAEIYKINSIKLASGKTYNIASADWSDFIDYEDCCPGAARGDDVCNDNFVYESILKSEPGPFRPCGSPNWVPYAEKQIIKYSKDDEGVCQQEIRDVGCASDYDCKMTNTVCDLNTFNCVQANINLEGVDYTKNIKDGDGDTSTCNPIFEQEISVDKTVGRGPLGIGNLFGWTKIETEKKCAPKSWVPIAVFGTIILILALAAILVNKKPRRQSQRRRR